MHPQCRRLADIPAADTPAADTPAADTPAAGTPADAPVMDIPAAGSLAADTPLPDTPAAGTPVATGSTLAADSPAGNLAENTTGPDTELHRPQEPHLRRIKRLNQPVRRHRHRLQPRRQLPHRLVMERVDGEGV